MLARMLWQSWRFGLKRKLLSIITIFLAASLVSALLAVSIDIGDKMAKEMKSYGANILVEPASSALLEGQGDNLNSLAMQDFLDEKELPNVKDIFWRNNIVGFAPLLSAEVTAKLQNISGKSGRDANWQKVKILGTFFDHDIDVPDEDNYHTGQRIISPYWQVKGQWVDDRSKESHFGDVIPVLVGKKLAASHDWKIGDEATLHYQDGDFQKDMSVKFVGILSTGGDEEKEIVMPLSAAQTLLNLHGKIQGIRVSALTVPENELSRRARKNSDSLDAAEYDRWYCTAYVSSIALQLEEAISTSVVKPIWQVAASEGVVIKKIQLLLAVVTVAAVIAAAMGIASLMTTTIIERSKEIGLMKALGAHQWQIVLLFYCEAIMSAVIGGLLGCLAGWGLAKFIGLALFGVPLSFAWIVIPCVLVLAILIALVGTWFPAHRIAKLYPVEVLYGRQ
ncbi:ABC transporter permease [Actinobacillus delphinicola]|uniref:Macrolide-specific ABC-type efflux carrier n=1 Tax=Actinobacillus delphinicola TaxID=51161 RepID=A0A448TSS2_9PAST|nr:ABC transporter permease [Actinobacillus delphinicola]VEJ09060.1 macrolide-specific ABC-type efflux carrier [Actinobacillus delphinicola]